MKPKQKLKSIEKKMQRIENISIGQEVKVHINLKGSQSNGRWFSQIQGWKVE